MKILKLKISLIRTRVNREVLVKKDITYHELHKVIQNVFGWEDEHLYEFVVGEGRIGDLDHDLCDNLAYDSMTTPIFADQKEFFYQYDFGDTWMHSVRIEKELEADPEVDYPVCVGGKRACPPEDCGGLYGYREILRKRNGFDPDDFTVDWANERLRASGQVRGLSVKKKSARFTLLARYIVALTYLYGILPKEELVKTFNSQNQDQITLDEVDDLLNNFPEELERTFVYSHRGHFVHETVLAFDDFDMLMEKKAKKPYYVPNKEELLKYVDDWYIEVTKEYTALLNYVKKHLIKDEDKALELVEDLCGSCQVGSDVKSLVNNFYNFGVSFKSVEQINEVMQLVMGMANNIRLWENNGHTPQEIFEAFERPNMRPLPGKPFMYKGGVQTVVNEEKVGRNDPCPCGSGKKNKKCCLGKEVFH
jgi:DNA-directed RNA polymerase subunit F